MEVPKSFHADETSMWLFTFWAGGFAFLLLPYCIYRRVKHGDPVALYAWIGGWIVSLGEPVLDILGHIWFPTNLPGPAFVAYGVHIPLLIPPAYVFVVCMTGYFAYRMFCRGITTKGVFLVWLVVSLADPFLELPGVLANVYKYYGEQPFYLANFPLHWAWMNGTGMMTVGLSLYVITPLLRENKLPMFLLILAPCAGWFASYGLIGWPTFLALNIDASIAVKSLIDLVSLALALIVIRCMAAYVTRQPPRSADNIVTRPVEKSHRETVPV
jgi:hypothetical protein